jgi:hypothetical protein
VQDLVDAAPHLLPGRTPVDRLAEEAIVRGVDVAHVGHHGQPVDDARRLAASPRRS